MKADRSRNQGTVTADIPAEEIRPVVLIDEQLARREPSYIAGQLEHFELCDDVYTKAFVDAVIVHGATNGVNDIDECRSKFEQAVSLVFILDSSIEDDKTFNRTLLPLRFKHSPGTAFIFRQPRRFHLWSCSSRRVKP